jgi:hypothetical protein
VFCSRCARPNTDPEASICPGCGAQLDRSEVLRNTADNCAASHSRSEASRSRRMRVFLLGSIVMVVAGAGLLLASRGPSSPSVAVASPAKTTPLRTVDLAAARLYAEQNAEVHGSF